MMAVGLLLTKKPLLYTGRNHPVEVNH